MALDRLAPDQRAVVQLVLQQERSYDELADLLGISSDAVRERARKGLERLDAGAALDEDVRGRITDYLLGQQSVSARDETRRLLGEDPEARAWAGLVSAELSAVARSPLPEIPAADPRGAAPASRAGGEPAATDAGAAPGAPAAAAAAQAGDAEPVAGTAAEAAPSRPVRARPRPRPSDAQLPPARGETGDRPRSSRLGGALLLGGAALLVAAALIFVVFGGDDDDGEQAANGTPTATATAEATPQPAGQIPLRQPGGGDAQGQMTIFISQEGEVAFTIEGSDVPPPGEGEAYAMWLVGGEEPRRLGFITDENPEDGNIGVSGPQESDADEFPQWLSEARRVVVTRETTQDASEPGPVVLRGTIPRSG